MGTAREEDSFLAYKRRPDVASLTALLHSFQDTVYNLCFQVLRHPEDAEDVSQEVLLEITRGIAKLESPRAFKVWLYRVALHRALNLKESRARRIELARRAAALTSTGGPTMDGEERAALMRAIGDLDDRTRCLLLEHYFDKLTLEEIGTREGVSSVAVWKRIDRAKQQLRRALLGVGFAVAAGGVAQALESVTPVAAPSGIAGKVLLSGGAVMATKSAISGGIVVAVLILVGVASTGGYFAGTTRAASQVRDLQEQLAKAKTGTAVAAIPTPVRSEPKTEPHAIGTAGGEAPREPVVEKTAPATKRDDAGFPIEDPVKVFYGRPTPPDTEDLVKAETWEEFYKRAKEDHIGAKLLEDLIFQRLGKELGLEAKAVADLRKLFDRERKEATRVIVDNSGGPAGFGRWLDERARNWNLYGPEWQRLRENVRRQFNPEYLKLLSYDQLTFFSDHLRNNEIAYEGSHSTEGSYYLISGVGKLPK